MNIKTKIYVLPNSTPITKIILNGYIKLFWGEIFTPLHLENSNMHLMLMCKVEFTDPAQGYRTLADMRRVNF